LEGVAGGVDVLFAATVDGKLQGLRLSQGQKGEEDEKHC